MHWGGLAEPTETERKAGASRGRSGLKATTAVATSAVSWGATTDGVAVAGLDVRADASEPVGVVLDAVQGGCGGEGLDPSTSGSASRQDQPAGKTNQQARLGK